MRPLAANPAGERERKTGEAKLLEMKQKRKRTLSREITVLTILTSVCTLLVLGVVMILVFFFIFFGNTKDDMEYILENTNQQFEDHIQFIQDGVITIRHNVWLDDFFWGSAYDAEAAQEQLTYNIELFSDRNIVKQQTPFVRSVYLFNNINECIYEHYYPMTMSSANQKMEYSSELQLVFKRTQRRFHAYHGTQGMYLCFRIYNEEMLNMGICIVEIAQDAIELLMEEIEHYRNGSWAVVAGEDGEIMISSGEASVLEVLKEKATEYVTESNIGGTQMLHVSQNCGLGVRIIVAAGLNNIYTLLKPTMLIFLVVLLAALLVTAFLSFAISYRFTKPIKKIIEGLRAFGQEDFDVRMEDYSIQEFHDIGVVFNEMADRIEYLIKQVYEKQIVATQSQVKFLQAQINPHFQFNILAMLSIKAKIAGNEELYQYLQAFSKLIQGKIFREREIKIPVSAEMELVNFYLLLQNGRYQDKISYEIIYGSESVKEYLIPRLLVEPLVENAVSHGLEPKNGEGKITVEICEKEEKLHIVVADDGVGFPAENLKREETDAREWYEDVGHTRTGLENTGRLLRILYGENYELHIQGEKGRGTTVRIVLPIERREGYVEGHGSR